jgi:YrbI family 3-deoxy-D-manno-octulosonate 8-phosphate phosphatase
MNPRVVAIIPARGGSKGVPGKNLRRVGGRSLVERAVDACRAARLVDEVYMSTDDGQIAAAAENAGGKVIMRPAELSDDAAEPRPCRTAPPPGAGAGHSGDRRVLRPVGGWVQNRPASLFGRTADVQVPELTAVDVDHLHDLALAGALAQLIESSREIDVDVVITDFDGVHTDDSATVAEDGRESVRVSRADGLGVERLRSVGIPFLIVSKEINRVVEARTAKLGVEVRYGVEDKRQVVRDWLAARQLNADRVAYLGNDINDLGPMALVGWPVAVADAHPAVRQAARVVLDRSGGHGAVRELCDLVVEHRLRLATQEVVVSFSASD